MRIYCPVYLLHFLDLLPYGFTAQCMYSISGIYCPVDLLFTLHLTQAVVHFIQFTTPLYCVSHHGPEDHNTLSSSVYKLYGKITK